MLNKNFKYPAFDTLEIITELEYAYQPYSKLSPVKSGDSIAGLSAQKNKGKWHTYFDENQYNQSGISFAYTKKPLVLYFYSKQWSEASLKHLHQLNSLQSEIQYYNANLLLISSDHTTDLEKTMWDHDLSLQVYADEQKEIAALFGIYSEQSPAWARYAGIEENVPLPAVFVLDHSRQVIFDHANEDILTSLPATDIVGAVYQSNKFLAAKRSA